MKIVRSSLKKTLLLHPILSSGASYLPSYYDFLKSKSQPGKMELLIKNLISFKFQDKWVVSFVFQDKWAVVLNVSGLKTFPRTL